VYFSLECVNTCVLASVCDRSSETVGEWASSLRRPGAIFSAGFYSRTDGVCVCVCVCVWEG